MRPALVHLQWMQPQLQCVHKKDKNSCQYRQEYVVSVTRVDNTAANSTGIARLWLHVRVHGYRRYLFGFTSNVK